MSCELKTPEKTSENRSLSFETYSEACSLSKLILDSIKILSYFTGYLTTQLPADVTAR